MSKPDALPEPFAVHELWGQNVDVYSAEQMRAYAQSTLDAAVAAAAPKWLPIETAPRGSGENGPRNVTHPDYVKPPQLLLWTAEGVTVGYYDWYYHEGYGRGAEPGISAWRQTLSSEPIYGATHYMAIPASPQPAPDKG